MRKTWKFLICILFVLLAGCGKKEVQSTRVVTGMDISCQHEYGTSRWTYTQPEKMEILLNHLRMRRSLGAAQTDPERLFGDTYRIVISLSDGSSYIYYQRADAYFSKRCHPWQKTDPKQAAALVDILRKIPDDSKTAAAR